MRHDAAAGSACTTASPSRSRKAASSRPSLAAKSDAARPAHALESLIFLRKLCTHPRLVFNWDDTEHREALTSTSTASQPAATCAGAATAALSALAAQPQAHRAAAAARGLRHHRARAVLRRTAHPLAAAQTTL